MPNYQKLFTTLFNRVEDVMTYINDAIVLKEAYDWDHPCSHAEAAGRPAGMRGHLRRCRIKILPDRPMEPVRECFT